MSTPPPPAAQVLKQALTELRELRARLASAEQRGRDPIAIVGIGCRFPGGASSPAAYWALLRDGVDATREVPPERWDPAAYHDPDPAAPGKIYTRRGGFLDAVDGFDARFFSVSAREARSVDPQHRLLLEVAWEALEDAAIAPDRLARSRTGVYVGISASDYAHLLLSGPITALDGYVGLGTAFNFAPGRLSYLLGLQGPSLALDSACSSSLVAVHLACQSLRAGETDLALAGGVSLVLSPEVQVILCRARVLAPDGRCKTFDAAADGYGRGEGCGVVALKRLADAQRDGDRIHAVIRGTAVNQDGPASGLTVPSAAAQQAVVREACLAAGVAPQHIDYVEAHGTGTPLGDPIEIRALAAALGDGRPADRPLLVGSAKTNLGHLEAAAGVAGLIKAALALAHAEIPPHLHLTTPNPAIDWDRLPVRVPTVRTPWPVTATRPLAGVSSFGASGTNAHVVLEAPPPPPDRVPSPRSHELFTLSARSEAALRALADRHERNLADHHEPNLADRHEPNLAARHEPNLAARHEPNLADRHEPNLADRHEPNLADRHEHDLDLADLCATANTGRATLPHRLAIVARTRDDLRAALEATARGDTHPAVTLHHAGEPPRVAFLFTGQGAQYVDMGRALYTSQPVFRDALDACDALLRPHLPRPLLAVLHGSDPDALAETVYTQPALFAVEWALAALWRSWGVEPAAVLGHSLGEYVAAAVAGVLSLADALRLVATRATAMQALPPGGAMEAVFADEATVAAAIAKAGHGRVAIAAINGPAEVVISGAAEAVAAVADLLAARGHGRRRLNVAHAFHSPLIEPALAALERAAGEVALTAPRIPLVSNLTGRLARDELTRPAYYREHARAPVRFHDGLRTLHAQGIDLFLEIGPAPVLAGMGRRSLPDGAALFLASLRQNHDPWATLLTSLGALFVRGVRVDWSGLHRGEARRKLALPTYPFERTRCWTDLAPAAHPTTTTRSPQPTGLALRRLVSPALGDRRIIEATLAAELLPALRDHRVYDRLVVSGVVHLQLVAAAIADDPAAPPPLEFSAVRFAQPLLLPESGARLVQAIVRPDADAGALHFELTSADATAPTRWTVHTTGRVRPLGPADVRPPARSLDLIRARCPEQRAGADFYAELWRPDEHHLGPSFRSIDHLWRRDGEALARLVLPPAELLAPDGSPADLAFARNACIGEVFGQALMPAVPDYDRLARDAHTTFIGHGVAASRDHEGAVQRARWCHAVLRESAPDHLVGDIALLDDTGVVISVVEGLRVQRVDRALVRQAFERMLRRADRPTVDPAALIAGDDPGARARLATYLATRVAAVAGVASTAVQAADSLRDLGLDSLLATELAAVVREDLGVAPELAAMVAGASLTTLADGLLTALRHTAPAPTRTDLAIPKPHDLTTPKPHDLTTPPPRPTDLTTPRSASPLLDDRWLRNLGPTAGAPRMRVFCIPHGGAGAAAFGPWRGSHPDLELCAVQLPGRGDRWTEPPHTRIDALVEALADAIGPRLDLPFALFGASLGALLSFELAHALRRRGLPSPALLIAAACPAPHIPALLGRRDEIVQALAARDDLAAVQLGRLGILPEALVREPEVVRMSLPALRADFGIVLGYAHRPAPPLAVPLLALGGTEDPDVAAEALHGWARYTTAPFRLHMLPGGHLFYREQPDARAEVLRACRQALARE